MYSVIPCQELCKHGKAELTASWKSVIKKKKKKKNTNYLMISPILISHVRICSPEDVRQVRI